MGKRGLTHGVGGRPVTVWAWVGGRKAGYHGRACGRGWFDYHGRAGMRVGGYGRTCEMSAMGGWLGERAWVDRRAEA